MKQLIANFLRNNREKLERVDRWLARKLFKAPAHFTISGFAWHQEQKGDKRAAYWRKKIDAIWKWIFNQDDHCRKAYDRDLSFLKEQS